MQPRMLRREASVRARSKGAGARDNPGNRGAESCLSAHGHMVVRPEVVPVGAEMFPSE